MKNIIKIVSLMIVALAVLAACQDNTITNPQPTNAPQPVNQDQTASVKGFWKLVESTYPIIAGQNIEVGMLTLYNDSDILYVNYEINEPWVLSEFHFHIGSSLNAIPRNRQGIPVPGQFAYSSVLNPMQNYYSFEIPLSQLNLTSSGEFFFAAHAVVNKLGSNGQVVQEETAWGGSVRGPGPRWWFYGEYQVQYDLRGISRRQLAPATNDPGVTERNY